MKLKTMIAKGALTAVFASAAICVVSMVGCFVDIVTTPTFVSAFDYKTLEYTPPPPPSNLQLLCVPSMVFSMVALGLSSACYSATQIGVTKQTRPVTRPS